MNRRLVVGSLLVVAAACSGDPIVDASGSSGESEGSSSTGGTFGQTSGSPTTAPETASRTGPDPNTTSASGDPDETGGYEDDGGETSGCAFTCPQPTNPNPGFGCNFFDDNCFDGEKCSAWANDGGFVPNSTRCSPVAPNADQVGESCEWEGSMVSGIDTCESGAHCWGPWGQTELAVCRQVCGSDPDAPICPADTACVSIGALPLCLPTCDPLVADACGDGETCISTNGTFACAPAISDGFAQVGDPCEAAYHCAPGTACIAEDELPGCFSGAGCCATLCELGGPPPMTACADPADCVAYPDAPPTAAYDGLGICTY
jgi:hypothetical protein